MGNGFEDLTVWRKSKDLSVVIYKLTKKFPKEDLFGITSQIRRSSISIPSNIAEGACRKSKKDFARFLHIAQGSCGELRTQLIIARDIGNLTGEEFSLISTDLNEIGRMIKGLERKQSSSL